jgi:hypothetical protein
MKTPRQRVIGKRFQAELRNVVDDDFGGNMSEYSRVTKVPCGTLGHYFSTHRYPRVDIMGRLLKPLGKESKARLLEAYLLDLTPPEVRGQVVVRGGAEAALDAVRMADDLGIDDKLRDCLEFMARLARENRPIRLMIEQTGKALGWKG